MSGSGGGRALSDANLEMDAVLAVVPRNVSACVPEAFCTINFHFVFQLFYALLGLVVELGVMYCGLKRIK